jgi:cell division protein FtsL
MADVRVIFLIFFTIIILCYYLSVMSTTLALLDSAQKITEKLKRVSQSETVYDSFDDLGCKCQRLKNQINYNDYPNF